MFIFKNLHVSVSTPFKPVLFKGQLYIYIHEKKNLKGKNRRNFFQALVWGEPLNVTQSPEVIKEKISVNLH